MKVVISHIVKPKIKATFNNFKMCFWEVSINEMYIPSFPCSNICLVSEREREAVKKKKKERHKDDPPPPPLILGNVSG